MRVSLAALAALSVAFVYLGCNAKVETTCVGGSCVPLAPNTVASSSSGGPCFSTCGDVTKPTGKTGEFPCEVEKILADNCRRCHTDPPTKGAPFPLVKYERSQELYGAKVLFVAMENAVRTKFMPLEPPKLTDPEITAITSWNCSCSPPRDPGVTCK